MPVGDHQIVRLLGRIESSFRSRFGKVELFPFRVGVDFANLGINATSIPIRVEVPRDSLAWIWYGNSLHEYPDQPHNLEPASMRSGYMVRIRMNRTGNYLGSHKKRNTEVGIGEWIPLMSITGRGRCPFIWPYPVTLEASESISIEAFNGTSSAQNNLKAVLLGYAVYPVRAAA